MGDWCEHCGRSKQDAVHQRCELQHDLEPPRWCTECRRRMTVQVTPTSWSARCVEHGVRRSPRASGEPA